MTSLRDRLQEALAPRYEVEGEIATGGMATVFRATDESLGRRVAIKVLRPELATAHGAERLLREARTLAGFNHPNVVAIHDAGEIEGLFYYIMDFVAGDTLRTRLAQGPLSSARTISLGSDLLSALEAIHAAGVIHRDIKPGNIFIVGERALLADFGIAKRWEISDESLTRDGQVIGTPGYMAPEQQLGEPATIRSDLYSVGLVLYEAVAGHPFPSGEEPDEVEWTSVPARLERALRRALAREPQDRWPDAPSFRAALAPGINDHRRAQRIWTAVGALLVATVIALVIGPFPRRTPAAPALLDLAIFPCEPVSRGDSAAAGNISWALATSLMGLRDLQLVAPRTSFALYESLDGDVRPRDWVERLAATRATRCELRRVRGEALYEVDLYVQDTTGTSHHVSRRRAPLDDPLAAAEALALDIVDFVGVPGPAARSMERFFGHDFAAVKAFFNGEEAFRRGANPVADQYYQEALAIDPTLAVARWRMAEVRRWLKTPISVDLATLYREDASALSPLDSLLLDARVQPYGPEQFRRYQAILARDEYRYDAYATLMYADEVYHRGSLWGIPVDSAEALLELAVRRDSFLVPAVEHLTMVKIRLGKADEAMRLRDYLAEIFASPEEVDVYYPWMWGQAIFERFLPDEAEERLDELIELLGSLGVSPVDFLVLVSRNVRYVDLPHTQERFGRRLVAAAGGDARDAAAGYLAQALGLLSLGRIAAGFARFDSLAERMRNDATRVQAAEWRVVPYSLGVEGFPEEVDVYYPWMWGQAIFERFLPDEADARLDELIELLGSLGVSPVDFLLLVSRNVRYVDLPHTQERFGRRLVAAADGDAQDAAAGYLAQALGLISLGRISAGFARFDSLAERMRTDATRVQAAEWRVVPYSLGLEGFPEEEARAGVVALERVHAESEDPMLRARAAFALTLFAERQGDRSTRRLWEARLDSVSPEADAARLRRLVAATASAADGRYEAALRDTESDLAYDSLGLEARPFGRSVLHLKRGEWLESLGDVEGAIRAWLWHENTDIESVVPAFLVQATEVDGALGGHARHRIVTAARRLAPVRPELICRRARDLERLWANPDRSLVTLVDTVRAIAQDTGCRP